MPRTSRHALGNIICHHIVQGINKECIFLTTKEKEKYKYLLEKYSKEFDIKIIAYCIMDNHVHMILYAKENEIISEFMRKVNTIYAKFYNKENNRVGYVYRNRFKSIPIMKKEQLQVCIKYIHMNPVKAGIVKKEEDYKYSSYKDYINKTGFINQEVLDFVFSSTKNYIREFQSFEYQDLNTEKQKGNIDVFLKKFLIQESTNIWEIIEDKSILDKFISYLKKTGYKFSKQDIAKVLHIGRSTLYRKMKSETKNDCP